MKYVIRAVKYFFYLCVVLALFIVILSLLGYVDLSRPAGIFRNGWDSYWQIAAIVAVFAGIYPLLGYSRREVILKKVPDDLCDGIVEMMHGRDYSLASREGEDMSFKLRSPLGRLLRVYEDKVTMKRSEFGYIVEGRSKDIVRIVSALENKYCREVTDEDR